MRCRQDRTLLCNAYYGPTATSSCNLTRALQLYVLVNVTGSAVLILVFANPVLDYYCTKIGKGRNTATKSFVVTKSLVRTILFFVPYLGTWHYPGKQMLYIFGKSNMTHTNLKARENI